MDDLISRSVLLDDIRKTIDASGCVNHEGEMLDCIRYASAVDAVIPVRCKECLWFKSEHGCPLRESGYFKNGKMLPLEDDFCSYGEKRCGEHD